MRVWRGGMGCGGWGMGGVTRRRRGEGMRRGILIRLRWRCRWRGGRRKMRGIRRGRGRIRGIGAVVLDGQRGVEAVFSNGGRRCWRPTAYPGKLQCCGSERILLNWSQAIIIMSGLYAPTGASAADLEGPPARRLALLLLVVWPGSAEDCAGVSCGVSRNQAVCSPWRKSAVRRLIREWMYAWRR